MKFDVTASDGAANGFNYEDSTFSPDEVRERIAAINAHQDWYTFDITKGQYKGAKIAQPLRVEPYTTSYAFFGPEPAGQNWDGAQTTVQRWYADPLLDNKKPGRDRTIRTVFTHDHFSPTTHQQTGLYAGLLVEPEGSKWFIPDRPDKKNPRGFVQMNTRTSPVRDGGPTSWQAVIVAGAKDADSYREFALEFQDTALAYTGESRSTPGPAFVGNPSPKPKLYDFPIPQALTAELNAADGTVVPMSVIKAFAAATKGNKNGQINLNPKARVDLVRQVMQGVNVGGAITTVKYGQWLITDPSGEYTIYTPIPQPFPTDVGLPPELRVNNLLESPITVAISPGLSKGTVPQQVPVPLADQFLLNGITLSDKATVVQVAGGLSWIVLDTGISAGVDRGEIYPMRDNSAMGDATRFQVFMPMTEAWCDSRYAVFPTNNFGVPQLFSSTQNGIYAVNYRNEPLAIRVNPGPVAKVADATDLTHVLRSIPRFDAQLNSQPAHRLLNTANPIGFRFPDTPLTPGMLGYDPYTPLLRAYENDNVQIRTLVGAHMVPHSFVVQGVKWYFEPGVNNFDANRALDNNSGFRNSQPMGISEHFEMNFVLPPAARVEHTIDGETQYFADYPYMTDSGINSLTNGNWGLMRAYVAAKGNGPLPDLMPLPNNADRKSPGSFARPTNVTTKQLAPERVFNVVAISSAQAKRDGPVPGSLVYNDRKPFISDAQALLYVAANDLNWPNGVTNPDGSPVWSKVTPAIFRAVTLKPNLPVEPMVLRVNAGDFITVNLFNAFNPAEDVFKNGVKPQPPFGDNGTPAEGTLPNLKIFVSPNVGLHPQLLTYDMSVSNGMNAGWNGITTIGPTGPKAPAVGSVKYQWYAGNIWWNKGKPMGQPVEFGAVNVVAADPLRQHTHSLVAALVVEPEESSWSYDKDSAGHVITRTSVNVTDRRNATLFREFVLLTQDDLILSSKTSFGFNFATEPFKAPFRKVPTDNANATNVSQAVSNQQVNADPQTPVFVVNAGTPVRCACSIPEA